MKRCVLNAIWSISVALAVVTVISGCGQKGALYLPEDDHLPDRLQPEHKQLDNNMLPIAPDPDDEPLENETR